MSRSDWLPCLRWHTSHPAPKLESNYVLNEGFSFYASETWPTSAPAFVGIRRILLLNSNQIQVLYPDNNNKKAQDKPGLFYYGGPGET